MTYMMGEAITILADDAPKLAEPVASGWQLILAFLAGIAVIVVLITVVKLHPFLALIFSIGVLKRSYYALALPVLGGTLGALYIAFWIGRALITTPIEPPSDD